VYITLIFLFAQAGPILIISFDGGGVKGTLGAQIIKRLAAEFPDLISRTSVFSGVPIVFVHSPAVRFNHHHHSCFTESLKFIKKLS
jgi:hypothetical protein